MKKEYIKVFTENLRASDHLILLPIFYAGGSVSKDISSHDLANEIRAEGRSVEVVREDGFNSGLKVLQNLEDKTGKLRG